MNTVFTVQEWPWAYKEGPPTLPVRPPGGGNSADALAPTRRSGRTFASSLRNGRIPSLISNRNKLS